MVGDRDKSLFLDFVSQRDEAGASWSNAAIVSHIKQHPFSLRVNRGQVESFVLFWLLPGVLEVMYLETQEPFRGQGLMSQHLRDLFEAHANCEIWLDVHESNGPARALYRKLGFELKAQRPHYYRDGGAALLLSRAMAINTL